MRKLGTRFLFANSIPKGWRRNLAPLSVKRESRGPLFESILGLIFIRSVSD